MKSKPVKSPAYRVLIVDDLKPHLDQMVERVRQGLELRRREGLFSLEPFVTTSEDAGAVADEIKAGRCSWDVIIADIYMPLQKGGEDPVLEGGAQRIYQAIKDASCMEQVFLVITSGMESHASTFLDRMHAEQQRLEDPWAMDFSKPQLLGGRANEHEWTYLVTMAVARVQDREWRRSFLRDQFYRLPGRSQSYRSAVANTGHFKESFLVLVISAGECGREMLARGVHEQSSRARKPFEAVRAGFKVPVRQLQVTLFGQEQGYIQGAEASEGACERAQDGTVFVDNLFASDGFGVEFARQLVRLIEDKAFSAMGSHTTDIFKAKLILGLESEDQIAQSEEHLADLLDVADRIALPRLAERPEDIAPLAEYFLNRADRVTGPGLDQTVTHAETPRQSFDESALQLLRAHSWPRDERELQMVVAKCRQIEKPMLTATDIAGLLSPLSPQPVELQMRKAVESAPKQTEERIGPFHFDRASGKLFDGKKVALPDLPSPFKSVLEVLFQWDSGAKGYPGDVEVEDIAIQYLAGGANIQKLKTDFEQALAAGREDLHRLAVAIAYRWFSEFRKWLREKGCPEELVGHTRNGGYHAKYGPTLFDVSKLTHSTRRGGASGDMTDIPDDVPSPGE